jgi:glutamyl-tRNA(Gln) amidotransferase subunit E
MRDAEYYRSIGFKCGLEIHQRLDTKEKLFCSCSAGIATDNAVGKVERFQRAVAGELGLVDPSTEFEGMRHRKFVYTIYEKSSCLVDVDEEPPHNLNRDALALGLKACAVLKAAIPDEVEVMRKVVVDGSDPSAFQRSMMIGFDGQLEVDGKHIAIPSIFLEEESSSIEGRMDNVVVYGLDRIGVPLVEIDTGPDIRSPQEAKSTAMKIGLLLRLNGCAQRGIGSIRQDVNISVSGGRRVEIKGFQSLESMDTVIENEVDRQLRLIEIANEIKGVDVKGGSIIDISGEFNGIGNGMIREALGKGGKVMGARISGLRGFLGREINEGRRLGSEVSDYAKMAGVNGIMHSDEDLSKYGIDDAISALIKKRLGVKESDAFIMVAGDEKTARNALSLAIGRAEMAKEGVVPETRNVDSKKNITRFMRPLPGGARMYPETDSVPVRVEGRHYAEIGKSIVQEDQVRERLVAELNNVQLVEQLIWSRELQRYFRITERTGADTRVVADVLLEKFKELSRQGIDPYSIDDEVLEDIFRRFASGKITKKAIKEIVKSMPKNAKEVDEAIKEGNLEKISGERLRKLVSEFAKNGEISRSEIMSKYGFNIEGDELNAII